MRCRPARGSSWRRTWSPDREDREAREVREVREAREAREVREAHEDREVREDRQVREFSCRLFFPKRTWRKKAKKKEKKRKMEGEVLGQANYPYIVLGGSLVMCIAVILMGFKM